MSLRGYKPKHRPAPWTQAFPEQKAKANGNSPGYETTKRKWWPTVEHSLCPVALSILGKRVKVERGPHHVFGREGELLCWTPGWLAVSREGHEWIHRNIEAARQRGWYAPKGYWDNPKRVMRDFPLGLMTYGAAVGDPRAKVIISTK